MDQCSPQPLEGRREVTTVRGQSQSMRFELSTSNSVNEDNWEREMIRAKSLDQEKVGGPSSSSFRGMEPRNSRHFCVGLSAGAPNTIQSQASAGPSNREMRGSSTERSTTGDESSDSDTVEGREYRGSAKQQRLLYIPVPDTKEERQEQIHYEPQAFESVHKMHQIQDDDPETDQRVSQEWAMGHPDGYQIGILPCSDASQAQVFTAFSIQGEGLSVQDSPIWPINGSKNVHLMHMANTSILLQARDNAVPLSRQCVSSG